MVKRFEFTFEDSTKVVIKEYHSENVKGIGFTNSASALEDAKTRANGNGWALVSIRQVKS
jgi:hypothetical protein